MMILFLLKSKKAIDCLQSLDYLIHTKKREEVT